MLRMVLNLFVSTAVVLFGACSDLGSAGCPAGECSTGDDGFEDPPPRTATIELACTADTGPDIFVLRWDLTIDPGPIVGGEAFGATFNGILRVDESALEQAQALVPGGYKRTNILELKATVHVRDGVTSETRDVVLTNEPVGETCAFDDNGNADPSAGPTFPSCSRTNDAEDGSNPACIGLGGAPDFRNPCGQFIPLPTTGDCDACAAIGKGDQCNDKGFCIDGDAETAVTGRVEGYVATGSGSVLFGWDDQSTGATVDDTTRPGDPRLILPTPDFDAEAGPNSLRIRVGYNVADQGLPAAVECTMASGTPGLLRPTPDSELISFPIQTR